MNDIRQRVYEVLEASKEEGWLSRFCDAYLFFIISLNVVAVIMESVASI